MKIATHIAAGLLGLIFVAFSLLFLLKMLPEPQLPEGSPAALFMGAVAPTGYLTFVKVCELVGGLLVVVPRTRNFGLLVLGPVIVNIEAFTFFITKGQGFFGPPLLVGLLGLFLLWADRRAFAGLKG